MGHRHPVTLAGEKLPLAYMTTARAMRLFLGFRVEAEISCGL